jgi:hypothetical protein
LPACSSRSPWSLGPPSERRSFGVIKVSSALGLHPSGAEGSTDNALRGGFPSLIEDGDRERGNASACRCERRPDELRALRTVESAPSRGARCRIEHSRSQPGTTGGNSRESKPARRRLGRDRVAQGHRCARRGDTRRLLRSEPARLGENPHTSAPPHVHGKERSTVRVRQTAFEKLLLISPF